MAKDALNKITMVKLLCYMVSRNVLFISWIKNIKEMRKMLELLFGVKKNGQKVAPLPAFYTMLNRVLEDHKPTPRQLTRWNSILRCPPAARKFVKVYTRVYGLVHTTEKLLGCKISYCHYDDKR